MSGSDEPADLARQMHEKAQQLAEAAEHTSDPHERERLEKKSGRSGTGASSRAPWRPGTSTPEK